MSQPAAPEITPRYHVPIKDQGRPVIFSFKKLVKDHSKLQVPATEEKILTSEDAYFKNLLSKYKDVDEGDDVNDSDSEEEGTRRTGEGYYEEYDYDDPFIDDSEMLIDEDYDSFTPEYDGFFVYYGPLDGNEDSKKEPKRADKSKTTTSTGVGSKKRVGTTRTKEKQPAKKEPKEKATAKKTAAKTEETANESSTVDGQTDYTDTISVDQSPARTSEGEATTTSPAKAVSKAASATNNTTGAPVKAASVKEPEQRTIDPEIQVLLDKLREDAKKESFEHKAKFPAALRPTTLQIGSVMLRKATAVDDLVVDKLMEILPYNRFTLRKFLTTKAGGPRVQELHDENEKLIEQLKATIDRMMPEQQRSHEEKVANSSDTDDRTTKFKYNDEVRQLIYKITLNDQAAVAISNEIAHYQGQPGNAQSEVTARKQMNLRILQCWPKGWTTTNDISRQNSAYKLKLEKLGLSQGSYAKPPPRSSSASHASSIKKNSSSSSVATTKIQSSNNAVNEPDKRKSESDHPDEPAAKRPDNTSNGPTPSTAPDANNNPSWRSTSMAIESLISDLQQ
ncbi:hypothetical protein VTP01DRAFT_7575 [Rhizomucor pusillus]|uniref:uncharacterized protein n=1 Tax=Rhizomucor pusillus TaxID=4840 RepID=UPI0037442481